VHAALLAELGGIILALGLLGRLAGRFGQSPIPLYLLAGLAFGHGGLLPLSASEEFISAGAEIGVILLLLTLGLEYTAPELVTSLKTHYPAGAVDFVLNALPGAAAALLLGWGPVAAVALGGITWISSSGVIAKVVRDLGRVGNRETPVILTVLVLEDLAMTVYLPILTALVAGAGLATGSLTLVIALAAAGGVLFVALRYGRVISRFVSHDDPEKLLLVVFGLTLLVAGLAQELQVSAAVGAFLVGIALSGEVAEGAQTLVSPLRDLFAAVFFVFFGLSTDPAEIPPVLLPAVILAVVTAATKIATGYWAARRAGIAARGRWRAGGALVARGEFSIVIAGLAASAGAGSRLGALATAYVLILVIVGPLAARYAEPVARRVARRNATPLRLGDPAEAADRDDRADAAPRCHHPQLPPVGAGVPGEQTGQGLVEGPHREPAGDAVQRRRVDRRVRAGDEQQREEDQLGDRGGGVGVGDHRGDRHAQRAETDGAEHQHRDDLRPVRRQRHPVEPADADDQCDVDDADQDAVRDEADEVHPRGQRRSPDPLQDPVLPPRRERDRELSVARAEHRQHGDRRHVVLQHREAVEVRAPAGTAEQGADDREKHDGEEEGEDRALRVPPER
jgi:CPA2 family monovalent cation:H+ antiporter-2